MPGLDFSHVVIGGGAVGLACAARLVRSGAASPRNVLLIERNLAVGQETSSRNSQVIHAGLYYPVDSTKARLCIKGKKMLYDLFDKHGIAYKRTGKWIIAQDEAQVEYLKGLREKAETLGVPTNWLSAKECRDRETAEIVVKEAALESPTTGIMDSHGLLLHLQGRFEDGGGEISFGTKIKSIDTVDGGQRGFRLRTTDAQGESFEVTTESVINCAGLHAMEVSNMIVPSATGRDPIKPYYAKGQYYAYNGPVRTNRLIYPCPEKDLAGLGTHLTLDMGGRIRFGPDVTWTDRPDDLQADDSKKDGVLEAVRRYIPSLEPSQIEPDYAGIRPKLKPAGQAASDFVIRMEDGLPGFVNLLAIESPGLTSSLAIAEEVEEILR